MDTLQNQNMLLPLSLSELKQLPDDSTYIAHEKECMDMWYDMNLYNKLIEKNKDSPAFIFMDGPPFVSGNLHSGHIAVFSVKSVVHIFKSMMGYRCEVKLGYDCHGLPALNKTADDNNLTIEEFKALDIATSNKLCEEMVFKYKGLWEPHIKRMRLVDITNEYMTRDAKYMESCWWIFKQIFDQGQVYKGEKVMPYSYGNQTPLSNFEASQNYKEKHTKSIYVGFETEDDTYFVAWTTTPWTLPANLALCVNADMIYVRIKIEDKKYIMAKSCIWNLFSKTTNIEILNEFKGSELVNLTYKPIFPFTQKIDIDNSIIREYKIVSDPYVTSGDIGSGIVHLAPAFGDDDFRVCFSNGLIDNKNVSLYCPIDDYGRYEELIEQYKGRLVFDCEDDIRLYLKKTGNLLKTQLYSHNYPYCWRTNTPLIYKTNPSYYIRTTSYKDIMLELNKTVNWYPQEIGEKRFHSWLECVKDWSVSRSTTYGTPIPLWISDKGSVICIGSISELETYTKTYIDDIHPQYVNDLVIERDGETFRRIPDTFDCWFESGAVPMAQCHYPFDEQSKEIDSRAYGSNFICEGMDQTRGWFYTLMVLYAAIHKKSPYQTVMCTGMILDPNGNKISKRLGNFIDPQEILDKFGADIIKTFIVNSPIINAESLKMSETNVMHLKRRFTPYINGVKFWIEHTLNYIKQKNKNNIDLNPKHPNNINIVNLNFMDKWILVRTNNLVKNVRHMMNEYRLSNAVELLLDFVDELTNWYIKFNRDRLKGLHTDDDWYNSILVLYNVIMLYCRLWAPITPYLSEHIFKYLKSCSSEYCNFESVILTNYPDAETDIVNQTENETLTTFKDLQRVCTLVRSLRDMTKTHSMSVVPLKCCTIYHNNLDYLEQIKQYIPLIKTELNCQKFCFESLNSNVSFKLIPDRKSIGQFFRKEAASVSKFLEMQSSNTLSDIYNKKITLVYKSSVYDEILDSKFFKLIKVPNALDTNVNKNLTSQIDDDLMVCIDHTYDDDIHQAYQYKRLHSLIQSMRKDMILRPWNTVNVILDSNYATQHMRTSLQDSLSNAIVTIADYNVNNADDIYNNLDGMHENDKHKAYGKQFTLESINNDNNITGRIVVYVSKKTNNL